ncbi:hypothetical protein AUP68_03286 [Ilyonectria robusta]
MAANMSTPNGNDLHKWTALAEAGFDACFGPESHDHGDAFDIFSPDHPSLETTECFQNNNSELGFSQYLEDSLFSELEIPSCGEPISPIEHEFTSSDSNKEGSTTTANSPSSLFSVDTPTSQTEPQPQPQSQMINNNDADSSCSDLQDPVFNVSTSHVEDKPDHQTPSPTLAPQTPKVLPIRQPLTLPKPLALPQPLILPTPLLQTQTQAGTPTATGTKRKESPVDLELANKPKASRAGKKCVPKSCCRCKRRKAKCIRDGSGDCTSCAKAGLPCIWENVDLREKSAVSEVLETKRIAHHKAYIAAADLVAKSYGFVQESVPHANVFDGVIASLTEKRNANSDTLIQAMPTIARCVAAMGLVITIDPAQSAPILLVNQSSHTKPQLKKHLDAYERASGDMINNFRKAIVAMMTPINEWPEAQASERIELCALVLSFNFDKIIEWGASSDWAQQLVEQWEAKNN